MNREVIQDFLNLPGIVGVALTNRRMRPYFYGLDSNLNGHQQQALGQGILQVVENIPDGFECFEFYFVGNIVFIYKLTHGLVLLVLTSKDLQVKNYQRTITQVKQVIESDTYNAVATFKLVLGSISQPSLPGWQNKETGKYGRDEDVTVLQSPKDVTVSKPQEFNQPLTQLSTAPIPLTIKTVHPTPAIPVNASTQAAAKPLAQEYKLEEFITALNKLSQFTTQYLGKIVVGNYWKSSKPSNAWLEKFTVDRNAQISCSERILIATNSEEQQQLQRWAEAYMQRCKQVIRNFDLMVVQDCLDLHQQELLIKPTDQKS